MIGRTVGNYKIEEKLGGGGMGVVYRAHDQKLDRTVALKFLPPHLAQSETRKQRFIREARAASALDHANVCTIYDIDETDDGQMFIAMGYCAGVPLDVRIAGGPLPVDACVRIATQIAKGLASAHAADIVHRDIKPANIIVADDDAVKIVDFGLAKLSSATALTREGTTVGTAAYMSPEQARGLEVDHRTDIWSLGAVLYEMVTGRRPFGAEHDAATLYLIINEDPQRVETLRGDAPEALAAIVHRMLQKDADARFGSMDDVVTVLEAMATGTTGADTTPSTRLGNTVARARAALECSDWSGALDAYREAAQVQELSAQDLEGMGWAAEWTNHIEESMQAWERAHARYAKENRPAKAARMAVELAHHAIGLGKRSVCNAWLKRAESLLEDLPDAVEHGYLARLQAQIALDVDVAPDAALEHTATTDEFAQRHDDADLRSLALQDRGRALILKNQVAEGMELLEEAMSMAMAGGLSPAVVGTAYCNMISMCERIADYRRASEWSDMALRWCEPHSESGFPGICSVRRADVMRVRGAWEDAESEADRAIGTLDRLLPVVAGEAYYLKGEINLRRGDFAAAEELFQEAHQRGRQPTPGLALLRLAQGKVEAARSLINRALSADMIALDRIRQLPAGVEIALAAGDEPSARERAEELTSLAEGYHSAVFLGQAAYASGTVALAAGRVEDAVSALSSACAHFKEADMPYDDARSRTVMAEAYWSSGDHDLALLEARTARSTFQRIGARADLEGVDTLIDQHS